MPFARLSLTGGMVVILLLAVDLATIRFALAPWALGRPLNQRLLNLLPMANALVLLGFHLIRHRRESRPFAVGFFVGGLASLLAHVAADRAFPSAMWSACDWLANNSTELLDWLHLRRYATLTIPGQGNFFRFYPAFALVVAAPQFLVAGLAGLVASALDERRRRAHGRI